MLCGELKASYEALDCAYCGSSVTLDHGPRSVFLVQKLANARQFLHLPSYTYFLVDCRYCSPSLGGMSSRLILCLVWAAGVANAANTLCKGGLAGLAASKLAGFQPASAYCSSKYPVPLATFTSTAPTTTLTATAQVVKVTTVRTCLCCVRGQNAHD